jgi:hypothetical protein
MDLNYESARKRTPVLALTVAWLVVLAPAAWGVTQTFKQSLKLFTAPGSASSQPQPR